MSLRRKIGSLALTGVSHRTGFRSFSSNGGDSGSESPLPSPVAKSNDDGEETRKLLIKEVAILDHNCETRKYDLRFESTDPSGESNKSVPPHLPTTFYWDYNDENMMKWGEEQEEKEGENEGKSLSLEGKIDFW